MIKITSEDGTALTTKIIDTETGAELDKYIQKIILQGKAGSYWQAWVKLIDIEFDINVNKDHYKEWQS